MTVVGGLQGSRNKGEIIRSGIALPRIQYRLRFDAEQSELDLSPEFPGRFRIVVAC